MNPRTVAVLAVVALLTLAAACSGETHTTVGDALAGQPNDRVVLEEARIADDIQTILRAYGTDVWRFPVVDRSGARIFAEIVGQIGGTATYERNDFVRIEGTLEDDEGRLKIWMGVGGLRKIDAPDDWPS